MNIAANKVAQASSPAGSGGVSPPGSEALGFDRPHPGGMAENSPTFQRWVREFRGAQVPKGRLMRRDLSAVPPGLIVPRTLVPNVETLGYYRLSLRDNDLARSYGLRGEQILVWYFRFAYALTTYPTKRQRTGALVRPRNGTAILRHHTSGIGRGRLRYAVSPALNR